MNNFFEAKVKYSAIDEQSGKEKKKNVTFLIDAMSYTESEARLHQEMQSITPNFTDPSMKRTTYTDVFLNHEGQNYYEIKIEFVTLDEEAGKEKKMINKMLIIADSTKDAEERINEELKDMIVDYEIKAVRETNIEDVFVYEGATNEDLSK